MALPAASRTMAAAPAPRRPRRTAHRARPRAASPADLRDELHQSLEELNYSLDNISLGKPKRRAPLHEEEGEGSLPRTVSVSDSSDDDDRRRLSSISEAPRPSTSAARSMFGTGKDSRNKAAVTGRLSNVLDDYVVFPKVLGEGHYGCVRECVHRRSRKTYACKSIDKSKIGRLDHLQREVNLLSGMDHKGVMKMVDCYEDADYVHLVTEKYTGGELFDKIVDNTTSDGCFSEEKTARIVKGLLEALAYLHGKGIAHRDIKPENILFASEGERDVKLIDFGLSRRHRKGDAPMSNPVGTAYYMSPELLRGKYDQSCDVWSLGTIVYILLAGYPPFNGEDDDDIFDAIRDGRYEFHPQQWDSKSDECKDLIKCMLRRDPRKRFTAKEALQHPWIVNLGKKRRERRRVSGSRPKKVDPSVRYLKIP